MSCYHIPRPPQLKVPNIGQVPFHTPQKVYFPALVINYSFINKYKYVYIIFIWSSSSVNKYKRTERSCSCTKSTNCWLDMQSLNTIKMKEKHNITHCSLDMQLTELVRFSHTTITQKIHLPWMRKMRTHLHSTFQWTTISITTSPSNCLIKSELKPEYKNMRCIPYAIAC